MKKTILVIAALVIIGASFSDIGKLVNEHDALSNTIHLWEEYPVWTKNKHCRWELQCVYMPYDGRIEFKMDTKCQKEVMAAYASYIQRCKERVIEIEQGLVGGR